MNLRVRRTQKLLREALIKLIEERGFDKLTVREISEGAMVSRAAFYRNYQDKYDLVEHIFGETIEELFMAVSETVTEHPPQIWVSFFENIAKDERLYRALLGGRGSPWFVQKMRTMLIDLLKEYQPQPTWQSTPDKPLYPAKDEFVPEIIASVFVEAITWWLEQGRPYTPQEMANRCISLTSAIFTETSRW
ncbi:MAG: TetR/AcrR family transcriptional regulator [Anaerolineaceae bacterium]|nr:TetR/AcrR family transcriptional regulator [Anaerolineaceae bacterium]